jgi:transcription factor IIIB subunit 2
VSLYIVCRREKSPHLLIDFADLLGENLFTLGSCYMKLVKLLYFKLPLIDPSLFIHRFCAKLDFKEKTHEVAMTALRILQRMKRDWISYGRRPTGLCGAAILISAKYHGLKRSTQQILQTVKVCNDTIRKRLEEFQNTPVAKLTRDEFESINIESEDFGETNPPSYKSFKSLEESQKALLGLTNEVPMMLALKQEPESDWVSDMDDDEIKNSILSPEESLLKRILWHQLNANWIEKQRFKETTAKDPNPRKRKRKQSTEEPPTAAEALKNSNRLPSGLDVTALGELLKIGGEYDYKPLIPRLSVLGLVND